MGRLSIKLLLVASAAIATSAAAGPKEICDAAATGVFKSILEANGVPGGAITAGDAGYDAAADYLKSGNGEKLDAAARSLTRSILSATVPGAGAAFATGDFLIGGAQYTIDEAERLRVKAFVCGTQNVDGLYTPSFFEMPEVRGTAPGINCDNFTDWITNYDKYARLEKIWNGRFSSEVRQYRGNDAETRDMLASGWTYISKSWMQRWAESVYRGIRERLKREAAASEQKCPQPQQPASLNGSDGAAGGASSGAGDDGSITVDNGNSTVNQGYQSGDQSGGLTVDQGDQGGGAAVDQGDQGGGQTDEAAVNEGDQGGGQTGEAAPAPPAVAPPVDGSVGRSAGGRIKYKPMGQADAQQMGANVGSFTAPPTTEQVNVSGQWLAYHGGASEIVSIVDRGGELTVYRGADPIATGVHRGGTIEILGSASGEAWPRVGRPGANGQIIDWGEGYVWQRR